MTTEAVLKGSPQSIFLHPLDKGALLKHLIDTNGRGTSNQEESASVLASLLPPTGTKASNSIS